MRSLREIVKTIFVPSYTDKKVEAIHDDTQKKLDDANEAVKRYNELLKKNGVTMQIVIAAGGDHGHH